MGAFPFDDLVLGNRKGRARRTRRGWAATSPTISRENRSDFDHPSRMAGARAIHQKASNVHDLGDRG
jgi:hypothetical protein